MVEVFKTDVKVKAHATMLVNEIQHIYRHYKVNFDLDDTDKILRVKCTEGDIHSSFLVNLLKEYGFHAEVLSDEIQ